MATVKVNPGICGLKTTITVTSEDMQIAVIHIESECPAVAAMEKDIGEIDSYEECFSKFGGSRVYSAADAHCRHVACPIPSAIIKGIEVTCGLALPKNVEMSIEKD
jgi:hypothetical protein